MMFGISTTMVVSAKNVLLRLRSISIMRVSYDDTRHL